MIMREQSRVGPRDVIKVMHMARRAGRAQIRLEPAITGMSKEVGTTRVSYRRMLRGVAEVEPGVVDVVVGAEQRVVDEVHRGVDDDE